MKKLNKIVHIARRFQKSININADIGSSSALEGFICPKSSQLLLQSMANQARKSKQGAFIWTGPYGSGKSSLAVALASVLCGRETTRIANSEFIGNSTAEKLWEAFPPMSKGWKVIPVVGRRDNPVKVIGKAIDDSSFCSNQIENWTPSELIEQITQISKSHPRSSGGLILFVDEMGKFLESAARDDHDVYFFQELAEAASRSDGRLLIVGVLHQSFHEYANRLSRELRDEWSKIQGRFVDLAVDASGEEQIELISRAIENDTAPKDFRRLAVIIADHLTLSTGSERAFIANLLSECWPLHPIVACLLGPISRRRFGQNQRSIFGFLNSAEHHAFQEFLNKATAEDLYYPESLWDYLRANLEPSILASPDGHRWSMAIEALERCEGLSDDELVVKTLKTVSLIDLFKERSGIRASKEILMLSVNCGTSTAVEKALRFLDKNSLVIYRKFQDSYGIYAGSDFDIEREVESVRVQIDEVNLESLHLLSGVQPILAKRHYHKTGALRWFDVRFCAVSNALEEAKKHDEESIATGQLLITVPTKGESLSFAEETCRLAARQSLEANIFVGLPSNGSEVGALAVDLNALDSVRRNSPELLGDSVARREIDSRISATQQSLADAIYAAFESSTWFLKNHPPRKSLTRVELNRWISNSCNDWYNQSPVIKNELLNRRQPSSSAVAARNHLLRLMTQNEGKESLGIEGYPAEAGLLHSILIRTKVYRKVSKTWKIQNLSKRYDPSNLIPAWNAAKDLLREMNGDTVGLDEIYAVWQNRPFGIAGGLLPILAVAFLISNSEKIAFYRTGLFRSEITDVDVDYLTSDPANIQLRWINLTGSSKELLSGLATVIQDIRPDNTLLNVKPIDVARELVAIHDELPSWVKRTQKLSMNTLQLRRILKAARDPNKFLFHDLPSVLNESEIKLDEYDTDNLISVISDSLYELNSAYTELLASLRNLLLEELEVPNTSRNSLTELRSRAENILGVAGDFLIDSFAQRLANFDGSDESVESIASMAVSKPVQAWVDQDVQRAKLEIASFCRAFRRAESFAHVAGREDKRQAMSIVLGIDGKQRELWHEFEVQDSDQQAIEQLVSKVLKVFDDKQKESVVLAALAAITMEYLTEKESVAKTSSEIAA